jgi:hypothetical protein
MVLVVVRQKGLDCERSGRRKPKKAKKVKGDHQVGVHSDKMILVVVRQGGWTICAVAKYTQGKGSHLLFFQGMMKRVKLWVMKMMK